MKILFVCDPITGLNYTKDSTIFLIEKAWGKNYECRVCTIEDLSVTASSNGPVVFAKTLLVKKPNKNNSQNWWSGFPPENKNLNEFDIIFIRTDPPFDERYNAAALILGIAENQGITICNSPKALMAHNEKLSTLDFCKYIPPTLISSEKQELIEFSESFHKVVFKPLNQMGGSGIFVVDKKDPNIPTIIEVLTKKGKEKIVIQKFLPEIEKGDKRILILNGVIVDCCLTRTPRKGSFIGNLAAGGRASIQPLSSLDRQIAEDVANILTPIGFFLLGLDIIGENLTEINVTSPTGFREITKLSEIDIGELFFNQVSIVLGKN